MSLSKIRNWVPLACGVTLLTGCVAGPAVLKTHLPSDPGETYGFNSNPPEYQPVVPIGQDVVVPRGKGALTLFVVIPRKEGGGSDRSAQYIDFNKFSRVDVTITGENLTNPLTTSISVAGGATSAAGTVVVTPGRNQIITAVAKDSSGNILSTVKGVATSLSGQVVNAVVKFGTTPTADALAALSPSVAPDIDAASINSYVEYYTRPTTNPSTGAVTYVKHPLFVDSSRIVSAINGLVSGGMLASAVASDDVYNQLGGVSPVSPAATATVRLVDPQGNPINIPTVAGPYAANPIDRNGDGVTDGVLSYNGNAGTLNPVQIADPVSGAYSMSSGSGQLTFANLPGGTFGLFYSQNGRIAPKPWWTLPVGKPTVTITPGATQTIDIGLIDISKPVTLSNASASFSSSSVYDTVYGNYALTGEWFRFSTEANIVYKISYQETSGNVGTGYMRLKIFDNTGAQLFQSTNATDSYSFASPATDSLYVYAQYMKTAVNVEGQALSSGSSLYNATINYGQ